MQDYYSVDIKGERAAFAFVRASVREFEGYEDFDVKALSLIEAVKKNQGYGTQLLRQICDEADDEDIILWLYVEPQDWEKGLGRQELHHWYSKHNFVELEDDQEAMRRFPKSVREDIPVHGVHEWLEITQ